MVFSNSVPLLEKITQTKTYLIASIEISVERVILYQSCELSVILKDENNVIIETKKIMMEGDDYKNWSNDDDYITQYVISKIQ